MRHTLCFIQYFYDPNITITIKSDSHFDFRKMLPLPKIEIKKISCQKDVELPSGQEKRIPNRDERIITKFFMRK